MSAFPLEMYPPQAQIFGQMIGIDSILYPLAFLVTPFLQGLIAANSRFVGAALFLIFPLMIWFEDARIQWYDDPKIGGISLDVEGLGKLLLVMTPAFLIGLFVSVVVRRVIART